MKLQFMFVFVNRNCCQIIIQLFSISPFNIIMISGFVFVCAGLRPFDMSVKLQEFMLIVIVLVTKRKSYN